MLKKDERAPTGFYGSEREEPPVYIVSEATRRSMRGNRRKDTKPELAVRRALWAAGLRGYRVDYKNLPGRPDIVFNKQKVAIFIHGCFWHRCPTCTRNLTPTANAARWAEKFRRNQERDQRHQAELRDLGYRVLVIWECQVKADSALVCEEIRVRLGARDEHY